MIKKTKSVIIWLIKRILFRIDPAYRLASNNRVQLEVIQKSFLVNKLLFKQCAEITAGVQFIGQELQDMYAYLYFQGKRDGFFVDIGAYDGITISNTYALEKLGWKGICIEPIPEIYQKLTKNRSCYCVNVAIYDEDKQLEFIQTKGGRSGCVINMSKAMMENAKAEGIVRELAIKTITFTTLMEKYNVEYIDFMSIDVEGSELNVLASIDFNRYKFGLITIENNQGITLLKEFMFAKGYKLFLNLGVDLIFIPRNVEIGEYWWNDL